MRAVTITIFIFIWIIYFIEILLFHVKFTFKKEK